MAIGNYTDVYTLEKYLQRVENISDSIKEEQGNLVNRKNRAQQELSNQIDILRKKEARLYKLLHVENLDELRTRISEYASAICPLSGSNLREACILPYKTSFDKEKVQFQNDVTELVLDIVQEKKKDFVNLKKEEIHEIMIEALNEKGRRFSASSGYTSKGVTASALTKHQKQRYKELIDKRNKKNHTKIKMGQTNVQQLDQDSFNYIFGYEWYEQTNGLSKSEALKLNLSEKDINERNNKIINRILNYCGGEDRLIIDNIIREKILTKDKYAFFVGENEKDITGILGEIQGLYYIYKLLGKDSTALQWIGGISSDNGGKKPHRDLLLGHIGIQVKNTTKDLEDIFEVNFASASIDTMLSKTNIAPNLQKLVKNYYATKLFNVPYVKEENSFVMKEDLVNADFQTSAKILENYNNQIEELLLTFATAFMYVDTGSKFNKNQDTNTLYLLGASSVVVASEILDSLLQQLEGFNNSFSVQTKLSEGRNIVDILNSSNEDIKKLLKNTNSVSISDAVTSGVILSSSFSFKI